MAFDPNKNTKWLVNPECIFLSDNALDESTSWGKFVANLIHYGIISPPAPVAGTAMSVPPERVKMPST